MSTDPSTSSKAPARRSLTSVDLGDLRPQVDAACAAAGIGPSTWLRDLVRRELTKATPAGSDTPSKYDPSSEPTPEDRTPTYRAWLDAAATAKLDRITEASGFRTRAAALRGLIEGVNVDMPTSRFSGLQNALPSAQKARPGVCEAIQALGTSNHHLVDTARQLRDLGKLIAAADKANLTAAVGASLGQAVQATHKHLEVAAKLVGELRPMLKTQKPQPQEP